MTNNQKIIKPQKGYQEKTLSCWADVAFGWWEAWAWKTFVLLLDPLRWLKYKWFKWVIFRRTTSQISWWGWLWDESLKLYSNIKWANPIESKYKWELPNWMDLKFSHMEYEKNAYDHQWLQYAFIWFDELTHFTKKQFFYLMTRNRSTCWIKPYIRATCNPDPESWVKDFIEWYLDDEWFVRKDRDWVIRYFTIDKDNVIWWDTKEEVIEKCPHIFKPLLEKWEDLSFYIKSFTFIKWSLDENQELLSIDPSYKANLLAQDEITRKALMDWCWKPVQDNLAIADYAMLNWFEKNYPKDIEWDYISIDVAWYWKDLAVIKRWKGWNIEEMQIFTKSWPELLFWVIESMRKKHNISTSKVIYDNDWIGWWLSDWWYICFNWWWSPLEVDWVKENYKNLKTQLYYHVIEDNFNTWNIWINEENIFVDWENTKEIKLNWKIKPIVSFIKEDIKAIKRAKTDDEWKKQIIPKSEQKNIIWRSPDFWDTIMMRKYFDFIKQKTLFVY